MFKAAVNLETQALIFNAPGLWKSNYTVSVRHLLGGSEYFITTEHMVRSLHE